MSITYKVRFVKFDGIEFENRPPFSVFIRPNAMSFKHFVTELQNRASILNSLEVGKHYKLFYLDAERDKIEIKDEYDFSIFAGKRITNVTAEYEVPEFDNFDDFAEYVKCFTPDGMFPGL